MTFTIELVEVEFAFLRKNECNKLLKLTNRNNKVKSISANINGLKNLSYGASFQNANFIFFL